MNTEIIEFLQRRFSINSHFLDGNCYFMALILKDRFKIGRIVYDDIYGHFAYEENGYYYDWTGCIEPKGHFVDWETFDEYDSLLKQRIVRDCIM